MRKGRSCAQTPLVVDLDGSLIRTDLLVESLLSFVRKNPLKFLSPLLWLIDGKANLKRRLAEATSIDATTLPYNDEILELIKQERNAERTVVLATASHEILANKVANHLGLFDTVLATSGETNLSAKRKRDVLVERYGVRGFDYVGNSYDDLPVWKACGEAVLVNPSSRLETLCIAETKKVVRTIAPTMRAWLKAMRLHQWAKNLLLFVPLVASHRLLEAELWIDGLLAFFVFGMCASATYLMNDLLDLADDRLNRSKKFRSIPDGRVPIVKAVIIVPVLMLLAFLASAVFLPFGFLMALAAYCLLTVAYSMTLKRRMMVDVITLSLLFTIRVIAGVYALDLELTFWILAFSMFMFLSLALVKRYSELLDAHNQGSLGKTPGRGYYPSDLPMIASLGASAGVMSVLVLAMYTQQESIFALYSKPEIIWLTCPMLLFWIGRVWMLTHRGEMNEDPVYFAVTDRISILTGLFFVATFWFAS